MRNFNLLLVFLLGCDLATTSTSQSLAANADGCYDPTNYGAVVDDGVDDSTPVRAALADAEAAGGTLCLPSGRLRVSRAAPGSYNRFAAISTHAQSVTVRGRGRESVLEVVGDQGAGALWVISLDPGASEITLRDFTIDTSEAWNTDEQTHAIQIGSGVCAGVSCSTPIRDVLVQNVAIIHPSVAGERKGDCVRLAGNTPANRVERVTITGALFTRCARSGVAVQRNVRSLIVSSSHFTNSSDQDIDFEPTGGSSDINDTFVIQGNTFDDAVDATSQGDYSVTIAGLTPDAGARRVIVTDNVFVGRGVSVYRASDLVLQGNVFTTTMRSGYGVIEVGNVLARAQISGNVIVREGFAGPLLRVIHHSGVAARDISVTNNVGENRTPAGGFVFESAQSVVIANNSLSWTVAASGHPGVYLRSTLTATDGFQVTGNRFRAPLGAGNVVFLGASPNPITGVSVIGNRATGFTYGINCAPANLFPEAIVSSGNAIGPRSCYATFATGD